MASKKIDVYLDVGGTPEVVVDWISVAQFKNKIEWVKDADSPDFEFYSIKFHGSALTLDSLNANKIKADNDTSDSGDHQYTIKVKSSSGTHSSTKASGPTGNRPVIRN